MSGKTARILRGMAKAAAQAGKHSATEILGALKRAHKAGAGQWEGNQKYLDIDLSERKRKLFSQLKKGKT